MTETLASLRCYMESTKPHEFQPGRRESKYCIPDMMDKGVQILANGADMTTGLGTNEDDETDPQPEAEDITLDVDM